MTSPSSIGRESECLASVVLPHSRSVGPRAVRGKELHAFMCRRAQATTEEEQQQALIEVPKEWRAAAECVDFSRMPDFNPETGVPELAIAWSPSTGEARELGRNGEVEHDDVKGLLKGDEIGGIIDWCALTETGVFITDFKFGWQALDRADVNGQLRCYAVFAAKLFGVANATVSFARIFDSGMVSWDIASLDEMKLMAAEAFIRNHMRQAHEARATYANKGVLPEPNEGHHCTYCPAFRFCPAKVSLLLSTLQQEPGMAPQIARLPAKLDHDTVSRMWPKLKQAEALIKKLKKDMREYARVYGAVTLPNGNMLGEAETETSTIDPVFAREPLEARFGAAWANYAIKTTEKITWSSLDAVLKEHSSHGRKAKLERTVIAELEAAGAIRTVTVHRVTEVSAKSRKKLVQRQDEEEHHLEAVNGTEETTA